MAVPTVYRWDDINAPQIIDSNSYTQVKAWFKAIFEDGYLANDGVTAKPSLNWAITYDDIAKKITLDMIGDPLVKNLMRVEVTVTTTFGNYVTIYEHQGNNKIQIPTAAHHHLWGKNDGIDKICPWVVIGTDRGIYFLSGYNDSTISPSVPVFTNASKPMAVSYIGDYINDGVSLGRNNQCVMGLGLTSPYDNEISGLRNNQAQLTYGGAGIKIARDYLNNYKNTVNHLYHYEALMSNDVNARYVGSPKAGLKFPYIDGKFYMKEFGLYSSSEGVYYGKMPALYYPEHNIPMADDTGLIAFTGSGDYTGDNFIGISGKSEQNEFYINVSKDWGI